MSSILFYFILIFNFWSSFIQNRAMILIVCINGDDRIGDYFIQIFILNFGIIRLNLGFVLFEYMNLKGIMFPC